jgi:transcriptional regulator with XRE-family HTH domain
MKVRDVGKFIREQRNAAQLSLRKLAERAGISNPYLSQIERGLRRPSAEILQGIAKALRISAETLYVKAGILDDREHPDSEAAIMADRSITEGQKQVLIRIYRSFREETDTRRISRQERKGEPVQEQAPRRATREVPAAKKLAGGRSPQADPSPHPAPLRPSVTQLPGPRPGSDGGRAKKQKASEGGE